MGYSFNLNFIWVSLDDLHLNFSKEYLYFSLFQLYSVNINDF